MINVYKYFMQVKSNGYVFELLIVCVSEKYIN